MKRLWLTNRLKGLGKKKKHLAQALSLPHSRISDIISFRRSLKITEITSFALFMRMKVDDVISLFEERREPMIFEYRHPIHCPEWTEYHHPGKSLYEGIEDDISRELAEDFADDETDELEVSSICDDIEVRLKQ